MVVHGAANLIVWIFVFIETIFGAPSGEYTLNDFQSDWWIGAVCLAIGLPWAIRYIQLNRPALDRGVPYSDGPSNASDPDRIPTLGSDGA
jgi:hypothetical protein